MYNSSTSLGSSSSNVLIHPSESRLAMGGAGTSLHSQIFKGGSATALMKDGVKNGSGVVGFEVPRSGSMNNIDHEAGHN